MAFNRAMSLEFRFSAPPKDGMVTVGVNHSRYYMKGLAEANKMERLLRSRIPFPFEVVDEPEIRIMGGDRIKGMMSVVMRINFGVAAIFDGHALGLLKSENFFEGFECTGG